MNKNIFKLIMYTEIVNEWLGKSYFEDMQKKLELAEKIVSKVDESYKMEAFKIVLSKLLESSISTTPIVGSQTRKNTSITTNMTKKLELAKRCSISVDELEDVMSIQDDSIKIIVPIQGNESFKRYIGSQCYLAAAEIIFEKDWIESKELAEVLRDLGIKDLSNLAPQLKKHTDIFRINSKRGNNKYKLTSGTGRRKAFSTIHKLAKGEPIES